jgi:hypothetical protein
LDTLPNDASRSAKSNSVAQAQTLKPRRRACCG